MEQRSSTSRYILTSLAIIVMFTAFVLIGLNALDIQKRFASKQATAPDAPVPNTGDTFEQGYNAARAQFSKLCPNLAGEMHSFTGTVISVSADAIVVKQETLPVNAQVDGVPDNRKVSITAATKIVSIVSKPQEQLAKELEDFQKKVVGSDAPLRPPVPFTESTLKISDLQIGQRVSIESAEDLTKQVKITATRIQKL